MSAVSAATGRSSPVGRPQLVGGRRGRARSRVVIALGLLTLVLAGCGSSGDDDAAGAGGTRSGDLDVLAAASLTETFTTLAATFEHQHPGARVRLSFDSSATLAEQVVQGAPADVLATADEQTMQTAVSAGAVAGKPRTFATNRLALVVPADNPAAISGFTDVDDPAVDYVVCVPSAPCGALTATVLDTEGVQRRPASEEVDVKAVLSKVQLDEADAGIVYSTDAVAAGDAVLTFPVPAPADAVNTYPVAALADAAQPELARAWVDLVLSAPGQQVLHDAGFGAP